jgi:hypothetical protein
MMSRTLRWLSFLLFVLVLQLGGCGEAFLTGDEGEAPSSESEAPTDSPEGGGEDDAASVGVGEPDVPEALGDAPTGDEPGAGEGPGGGGIGAPEPGDEPVETHPGGDDAPLAPGDGAGDEPTVGDEPGAIAEGDPEEGDPVVIGPIVATPVTDPFVDLARDGVFFQVVAGVSGTAYGNAWSRYRDLGYHPSRLEAVVTPGGAVRYSGVWTKDSNVRHWESRRGILGPDLAALVEARRATGYRVVDLDAQTVGGEVRYHVVLVREHAAPSAWDAGWGLTRAGLLERVAEWALVGMRPIALNGYSTAAGTRFAVVGVADGLEWEGVFDVTSTAYGGAWSAYRSQGYVPADISSFVEGGELRFNGLWVRDPEVRSWISNRDMTFDDFERLRIERTAQNYVMVDVDSYYHPGSSTARYSGIWVRRAPRNVVESNLPLASPEMAALDALLRDYTGTMGFFIEDLESGNYVSLNGHEHFYMASTTKVLIALRVLDLIDAGTVVDGAPLTLNRLLPFRASDYRQSADNSVLQVGQSYTVEQYLRWMINRSSTGATDRLHGLVAGDLEAYVRRTLGLQNVGEITSICELDQRILEPFDSCFAEVPCEIFEPWWRDLDTSRAGYSQHTACLGTPGSLRRPSGTATYDRLYSEYYATLANSITPATYGQLWRRLVRGELLSDASTDLLVGILDATPDGYVDDLIVGGGFYDRLGGKHGGKRKSRSWVGLAWRRAPGHPVVGATYRYSLSIFTESWATSGDDELAKAAINQALGHVLTFLEANR